MNFSVYPVNDIDKCNINYLTYCHWFSILLKSIPCFSPLICVINILVDERLPRNGWISRHRVHSNSLGNFSLSIKTVGLHMLKLVQWTKKVWISCFEQICTFHSMVFMSTLVLIRPHFFSLPLIVGTEQIHWSLEGGFPHTDG